jgi:exosome complex component RRP4
MKQIIFPGEQIKDAKRMYNTYTEHGKAYSKVVGLYDIQNNSIIPLEGAYIPHKGDEIIGIVTSERNGIYDLYIQHFDRCLLITDKRDELIDDGTVVSATIRDIENKKTIIVEMPRKLSEGMLIYVKPMKIPRVIGRNNTMVNMISEYTNTHIVVGMNGLVWLKGGNTSLAIEAILRVENEAHVEGLTNRIKLMLENEKEKEKIEKVI